MTQRRVVITGLGMLSPVGNNVKDSWNNILQGNSGTKPITKFDVSEFDTTFAASIVQKKTANRSFKGSNVLFNSS